MPHSPPRNFDSMEHCLCFNLRKASRLLTQFYTARLKSHGLLATQTPILHALSRAPGATMGQLSAWLGMDRTTLVRNLRPLERDGLVTGTGGGKGQRRSLELTPAGVAFMKRFGPDWRRAQREAVSVLGGERWERVIGELERAVGRLGED